MIRSILPVGQGAFYTECFEGKNKDNSFFGNRFNVVYDCGSMPDPTIVEKEIRNHFQKDEPIEAVFISHLDNDHINGIPYLLGHCHVKRMFFPLLTPSNKIIMQIKNSIFGSGRFSGRFVSDPAEAISELGLDNSPKLIGVKEGPDQTNNRDDFADYPNDNIRDFVDTIESGEDAFANESINRGTGSEHWVYIPYNYRNVARAEQLMINLEKQFGRRLSPREMERIWRADAPGDRDKIKAAYIHVSGGTNTNSMTLFSGIRKMSIRQQPIKSPLCICGVCKCCTCASHCFDRPAGCLYTGDYDASGRDKWKKLRGAYDSYWEYIGAVQVPHHGSIRSFNDELADMDAYSFISAGYSNRHRHPHSSVIKRFVLNGKVPYIITEQVGSAAFFMIG